MLGVLGAALVCMAVFIAVERRAVRPMLDLSLFRYPRFVGVQLLPIATCFCFVVLLILLPVRFIGIEGRSETRAGLIMLALSAPMLIVPYLAGVLTRWVSARVLSAIGLLIAAAGLLLLSRVGVGQPAREFIVPLLVIGAGAGLPWGLMDGLSISVVPKERAGMASGIFSTTRVAGEGIALAIVSVLLAQLMQGHFAVAQGARAAQYLAAGDLEQARRLLPELSRAALGEVYRQAFAVLLHCLAALTMATSLLVLWFCVKQTHSPAGASSKPVTAGWPATCRSELVSRACSTHRAREQARSYREEGPVSARSVQETLWPAGFSGR